MQWTDEGLVLSVRRHGETSAIVELLTRDHGRHAGMVRGGRSKHYRPILQVGNKVSARWNARLPEHLGLYIIEPLKLRTALIMPFPARLLALQSVCELARNIAEREPHAGLFEATDLLMEALANEPHWSVLLVHWELGLLAELGFGLDLSSCAATGERHSLVYVSPKSGRAVSASAGEPYKDKLLPLPAFLLPDEHREPLVQTVDGGDVLAGLRLTGFFLQKVLAGDNNRPLSHVRQMMVAQFERDLQSG